MAKGSMGYVLTILKKTASVPFDVGKGIGGAR